METGTVSAFSSKRKSSQAEEGRLATDDNTKLQLRSMAQWRKGSAGAAKPGPNGCSENMHFVREGTLWERTTRATYEDRLLPSLETGPQFPSKKRTRGEGTARPKHVLSNSGFAKIGGKVPH